jgi:vancomycin permeability regulator SanA
MNIRRLKKILLTGLGILLAIFVVSTIGIIWDGLHDNIQDADIAIVPGNAVKADGQPSARLKARLDKTVELYQRGLFKEIIVSGGFGSESFNEATVMKNYLVKQGIAEGLIHVDSDGTNTYLTAKNAARIMRGKHLQSAIVISQFFHLSRSKLALKRFGVSPVYQAHAKYFEARDFYSTAREVVGFYAYLLRSYN